jgi:hypothetical protein
VQVPGHEVAHAKQEGEKEEEGWGCCEEEEEVIVVVIVAAHLLPRHGTSYTVVQCTHIYSIYVLHHMEFMQRSLRWLAVTNPQPAFCLFLASSRVQHAIHLGSTSCK